MWQAAEIDTIALSHGQARWVAVHLNLRVGDDDLRFDAYLKALRRAGVPFSKDELGTGAGHNLTYRYDHLMEIAVALYLRFQAMPVRDIISLVTAHRPAVRDLCRQAFVERESGLGAIRRVTFSGATADWRNISGCYLTFMADYTEGGALLAGPPRLIDPLAAFDHFLGTHDGFYPKLPVPVSELAARVAKLAPGAPVVRRGPP